MKEIMRLWHNVFGPAGSEYAKWVRRHSICPLIGNILGLIAGFALVMWVILSLVSSGELFGAVFVSLFGCAFRSK
ncbi:MAG TPA: hypothetical protein DCZ91_07250 [Lachnospiraceae bacterium]|nr:hypothetical protein [Lachnospiraceae bacterium]